MKRQVRKWLKYAKIDLLSAKKLLEDELLTQSVAFHAHQAIEKSFKSVLENEGVRIPKTHVLEKLYGLIQEIKTNFYEVDEDTLTQINDVYIDSRYPGDVGLIPDGIPSINKASIFYRLAFEMRGGEVLSREETSEMYEEAQETEDRVYNEI